MSKGYWKRPITLRLTAYQRKVLSEIVDGALDAGACKEGLSKLESNALSSIFQRLIGVKETVPVEDTTDEPQTSGEWRVEPSIPADGFECFYLFRNGVQVAEIDGGQTKERTRHLNDLVAAANRLPSAPADTDRIDLPGHNETMDGLNSLTIRSSSLPRPLSARGE